MFISGTVGRRTISSVRYNSWMSGGPPSDTSFVHFTICSPVNNKVMLCGGAFSSCDGGGLHRYLSGNNLTGMIPSEMGVLTAVTELYVPLGLLQQRSNRCWIRSIETSRLIS
jgi:hypothetical protein